MATAHWAEANDIDNTPLFGFYGKGLPKEELSSNPPATGGRVSSPMSLSGSASFWEGNYSVVR